MVEAQNYEEGYIEGLSDEQRHELEVQLLQDGGVAGLSVERVDEVALYQLA